MARRKLSGVNPAGATTHTVEIDEAGTGADTLRRKAPYTDTEVQKTWGYQRMFRAWGARGSKDGQRTSKWSGK